MFEMCVLHFQLAFFLALRASLCSALAIQESISSFPEVTYDFVIVGGMHTCPVVTLDC